MKIQAFNPNPAAPEKTITLKLIQRGEDVEVVACDAVTGERVEGGSLLSFKANGTIHLYSNVDRAIGFQLDACKRIIISC